MDWERAVRRTIHRRRLLQLTGLGSISAVLAACGGAGSGSGSRSPSPAGVTRTQSASPSPSATPTPTLAGPVTLRYAGLVADDGTWDPHRTQAGPVAGQQALVFSRLLTYESQADGTIVADLASALPEQPDERTLIFRLNPDARWHDRFPLNGRQVNSQDVKYSIERQRDGDAGFIHKPRWQTVENVETIDPLTVRVTLVAPLATTLATFAGVNSFVVAPETSPDGQPINIDLQAGSGPFRWVEWQTGEFASVARNSSWFGGNRRPYLDGIDLIQPRNNTEAEAYLRVKKLDAAVVGRPTADRLRSSIPELVEQTQGTSTFFGMRFFTPQFPYNDQRFRKAVSIVLDRRAMIERFFAGSGAANSWISWPLTRWALPEAELASIAGHRPGEEGRQADVAEAVALLAAFASERTIPEDNALFVIDEAEAAVGIGTFIRDQLKRALNLNVSVYAMSISELVSRLFQGEAPWAAGPDTGSVDLDDWLYPYFHSAGAKNTMAVRDAETDALIEAQRVQFDPAERQQTGYAVQRRLLDQAAAVNFVSERLVALAWPYVEGFPLDTADGYQHRFADTRINTAHESIRGRL
jgi:peptide/nickel transport system substrate-binding protein